jgi:hypothetical protein
MALPENALISAGVALLLGSPLLSVVRKIARGHLYRQGRGGSLKVRLSDSDAVTIDYEHLDSRSLKDMERVLEAIRTSADEPAKPLTAGGTKERIDR